MKFNKGTLAPIDYTRFRSVTQTEAASWTSDKYAFIPTTRPLQVLQDHGWQVVEAREARTRDRDYDGFQKHSLRLLNERFNRELAVGTTLPQIVLTNSHGGASAFELEMGLYEKVCANGLVVARERQRHRIRHVGYADGLVEAALNAAASALPEALAESARFKRINLSEAERLAFARSAIELRWDGETHSVAAADLVRPRHAEQSDPSLWNTYNTVQEHVIRGGVAQVNLRSRRRTRTREVNSIDENLRLNRALWTLTEELARIKQG
jgi:hypothetical protein